MQLVTEGAREIAFGTNNTVRMAIDFNGNVTINNNRSYRIKNSSGTPLLMATVLSSNNVQLFPTAPGVLSIGAGGSIRMSISASGQVSIGTTGFKAGLYIRAGGSDFSPGTDADDFLISNNVGIAGMTIASGGTSRGVLFFGRSGSGGAGRVEYDHDLDRLQLFTTNVARLTITVGGNVGIGVVSPEASLHVRNTNTGAPIATDADQLVLEKNGNAGMTIASGNSSNGSIHFADPFANAVGRIVYNHFANAFFFYTGNVARVTISSSGALQVVNLADSLNREVGVNQFGQFIIFSSDSRLKNEMGFLENGLEKIMKLKPRYFSWKDDPANRRSAGFFAQEVHPIVPEAAPYNKKDDTWGFSTGAIVTTAVKAIQEQQLMIIKHESRINKLENRVEVLEGA